MFVSFDTIVAVDMVAKDRIQYEFHEGLPQKKP